MRKHPDLESFQSLAGNDVIGIGRAIEEAGQARSVWWGTGLPEPSANFLNQVPLQQSGFDPKDAGLAMNKVAKLLLEKKAVTDGVNLSRKVSVKKGPGKGP